jgi:hypothetical protein
MISRVVSAATAAASVAAAAAALAVFPGAAAAAPVTGPGPVNDPVVIGPDESFVGDVNGAISNGTIQMGCFGPVRPGEMGHPLAGQSTEVQLNNLIAATGFTGNADQIEAVLTFPQPTPVALPIVLGTFNYYYVKDPISTGLLLPCYGSGEVKFIPVNGGPLARPWDETVSFQGQP